jgi:hypothetical protein
MKLENARLSFLRFGLFITAACPECEEECSWRYDCADWSENWSKRLTCSSSHTYFARGRIVPRAPKPDLVLVRE